MAIDAPPPAATVAGSGFTGGGHCRMITRKTEAAGTGRIPYPNPNAKGFCMDRKIHRGVVP